jgi:predicted secreted protein
MRFFIILLFLLNFLTVYASDVAQLSIIGFSKNAKFFAFEQFGTHESSNENYADLFLLDIEKNDFAIKPFQQNSIQKSVEELREINKTKAKLKLKELQLIKPEMGNRLLSRPLTDLSGSPYQVEFSLQPTLAGASSDTYILNLETKETDQECFGLGKAKIFTLTLKGKNDNQIQVLQKDTQLPTSRGCPLDYRIAEIVSYQDKIVIFINMFFAGAEGHNMRYLAVTAHINDSYKKKTL